MQVTHDDVGFPLNALYPKPENRQAYDQLKAYMTQMRQEIVVRLVERLFVSGSVSKWWMAFQKRKFLNKSLGYLSGMRGALLSVEVCGYTVYIGPYRSI